MSDVPEDSRSEETEFQGRSPDVADASGGAELGERWLTTIPRLADHQLRVAYARAELERTAAGVLAKALNVVCQRAEASDGGARQVVFAFVPTLVDSDVIERVWSLRATANAMALLSVSRLLRASTPEGHHLDQNAAHGAQGVLQNASGRPLTLGERRALARRPSRATLDKLLRDPHPMVTRILLGNPRITEDDVVRMAAVRPAVARISSEIAMAWSRSSRVRLALIQNPTAPAAVAVPLLALLTRQELDQVARAADLPSVTRATALEHYELRPPMPATEPPPHRH